MKSRMKIYSFAKYECDHTIIVDMYYIVASSLKEANTRMFSDPCSYAGLYGLSSRNVRALKIIKNVEVSSEFHRSLIEDNLRVARMLNGLDSRTRSFRPYFDDILEACKVIANDKSIKVPSGRENHYLFTKFRILGMMANPNCAGDNGQAF